MIAVQYIFVLQVHDGSMHAFTMDGSLPVVFPGLLLRNVPGIPNITGPAAEFDNKIIKTAYDGELERMICQIGTMRYAASSLDEVKEELPEWTYLRQLQQVDDIGPQDYV